MSAAGNFDSFAPGRLWNLWDMLSIKAREFYFLAQTLIAAQRFLEGKHDDGSVSIIPISDPVAIRFMTEHADKLAELCKDIGATFTLMEIDRLRTELRGWYKPNI